MRVFGTIGLNGSGKDEVVKYLHREYAIPFISVGDIVSKLADNMVLRPSRNNLHQISMEYIETFGQDYFASLVVKRIEKYGWQKAGITGIRTPEDVHYLKGTFGRDFILFHVYVSDPYTRYVRTKKRSSQKDQHVYSEFLAMDRDEENLFRINEAIQQADYTLKNNGTIEQLHRQLDRILLERDLSPERELLTREREKI